MKHFLAGFKPECLQQAGALTPTWDTMERVRLGTAPATASRIKRPGKVKALSQSDNDFCLGALPPGNVGISWVPQYIKYRS